jgi:hypothetical protein
MRKLSKSKTSRRGRNSRGSALLMSLVIMVGLSLLGLGFVAISETESAISINERHAAHTQAMAEAGARAVVEWFQDPQWARNEGFLPANSDVLIASNGYKRSRTVGGYTGVYRPGSAALLLLDRPFKPNEMNRFYGDDATADLEFNRTNANTTLSNLTTSLFGVDTKSNGRIEEIKVYAPPIIGGTLTGGFWVGGDRYGLATIKVTAAKYANDTANAPLLSRRIVRIVVGEFPMPVPGGPVQSTSAVAFGGTADVHWGDVTSFADLASTGASMPDSTFPWANPYDRPAFEHQYDTAVFGTGPDYLSELLGKTYEDPWFGTRTRGPNGVCSPNCGAYATTVEETNLDYSSFENQTSNTYPTSKLVTFPDIRYEVWKKIALAGRGMKGIYYFQHAGGTTFRKNGQGTAREFAYWVNALGGAKLGAGLYFFDTTNGLAPSGTTNLTPQVTVNSGTVANPFRMEGFVYLNSATFDVSGIGSSGRAAGYSMPAEIYRDIGYRPIGTSSPFAFVMSGSDPVWNGVSNGQWDFQDVNGNGRFDLVLENCGTTYAPTDSPAYSGPALQSTCRIKTWNPGTCTALTMCSEPHEPYVNFIYPEYDDPRDVVVAKWEPDGSQTRRPKKRGVTQNDCDTAPTDDTCTSNKYDGPRSNNPNDSGALVELTVIIDGILFNEGAYSSSGNADYYGSLLFRGNATGHGTPVIWFNERLLRGEPPMNMPRVMIYSIESDPVS